MGTIKKRDEERKSKFKERMRKKVTKNIKEIGKLRWEIEKEK